MAKPEPANFKGALIPGIVILLWLVVFPFVYDYCDLEQPLDRLFGFDLFEAWILASPVVLIWMGVLAFRRVFRMSASGSKSSWRVLFLALAGLVAFGLVAYCVCDLLIHGISGW